MALGSRTDQALVERDGRGRLRQLQKPQLVDLFLHQPLILRYGDRLLREQPVLLFLRLQLRPHKLLQQLIVPILVLHLGRQQGCFGIFVPLVVLVEL